MTCPAGGGRSWPPLVSATASSVEAKSVVLARIAASRRAVRSSTSSRCGAPVESSCASPGTSSGVPNSTSARPRTATLSSYEIPMGTIRTPSTPAADAASAMRATPVRRGRMLGSSCVVPSGNTATTLSSSRARTAAAKVAVLSVPSPASTRRCTGTAPANSNRMRAGATDHRVALARNRGNNPSRATSSTGSTNPLRWLAARITRPPGGGAPATSTERKNARVSSPATNTTTRSRTRGRRGGAAVIPAPR